MLGPGTRKTIMYIILFVANASNEMTQKYYLGERCIFFSYLPSVRLALFSAGMKPL
jgi:hypothetical protein